MSTTEKCFCHLNGFKVKDADARAEIENIKGALGDTNANVSNNALAISVLESKESPSGEQFDDLVDATNSISSRVTTLESGSGSGGGKLYYHRIWIQLGDPDYGVFPYAAATIGMYGTSPDPLTVNNFESKMAEFIASGMLGLSYMRFYCEVEGEYYNTDDTTGVIKAVNMQVSTEYPQKIYLIFLDENMTQTLVKGYNKSLNYVTDTVMEVNI